MYEKLSELKEKLDNKLLEKSTHLESIRESIIDHIKSIYSILRNDDFLKVIGNKFSQYKIGKELSVIIKYNENSIPENKCNVFIKDNPCIDIFCRKDLFKKLYSLSYYPVTDQLIIQREILKLNSNTYNYFKFNSNKITVWNDVRKLLWNYPLSTLIEVESVLSYFIQELKGNLFEKMIDKILEKL